MTARGRTQCAPTMWLVRLLDKLEVDELLVRCSQQSTTTVIARPFGAVAISSIGSTQHLNHRRFPRRYAPRNDKRGRRFIKLEFGGWFRVESVGATIGRQRAADRRPYNIGCYAVR